MRSELRTCDQTPLLCNNTNHEFELEFQHKYYYAIWRF